jgi:2-oxoisovalerate dehydrogenase E1 component
MTAEPIAPSQLYRGYPVEELLADLRLAMISRALDDREMTLQKQSRVFFQISGAGHEALLLGLVRHLRPGYDWFFPYYRDRALVLGLGVEPADMLRQAVGSAADPASGGRQMPCHWGDVARNIVTQSSPTGSQCIPAVGCAEASRYIARRSLPGCRAHGDELTYVSLGEGATSEGEFWESLNTACRLHLPVLYLVADNGWAISVRAEDQQPAPIRELVQGFRGLAITSIDGRDYFQSRRLGGKAVARVRAGEGPGLVHARVTRPYSHSAADTQAKYRSADDLRDEHDHDPIQVMARELVHGGLVTVEELERMRDEARAVVAAAADEALADVRPDPASVRDHVWALPAIPDPGDDLPAAGADPPGGGPTRPAADAVRPAAGAVLPGRRGDSGRGSGEPVAFGEAIRLTLHELMARDERIRVFGEDVADAPPQLLGKVDGKGGVFGTTLGLQRAFGDARCFNTPLSEANIVGRAVGQALRGLRPFAEIQFFDYIWPAMTQIKSEAATIRWRSNGAFRCPLVLRVPIGGYLTGGAIWHSQCGESIFAHVPGLIIMFPSRARDAAGLLRAAHRCEDPVLFLEHKHLLRQLYTRDPFPPPDFVIPVGRGARVQRGDDLTIVTYGATVEKARRAAAAVAAAGSPATVEIIDLRTIAPWDHEMVAASIERTGRALVLHEDVLTCGFGAEVAAWIGEHCFGALDAPVVRVGALDTPIAYEPALEDAILPQVDDIAAAVRQLLAY